MKMLQNLKTVINLEILMDLQHNLMELQIVQNLCHHGTQKPGM